jgi:O-Antigen ligase
MTRKRDQDVEGIPVSTTLPILNFNRLNWQPGPPPSAAVKRSAVHLIALSLVWLTVVSGAIVFTEPAPVDLLTIGLIVLLPVIGLVAIKPGLVIVLAIWLTAAAAAFAASAFSTDVARSSIHSGISVYLYLATFVFASFIARRPLAHTKLVLHAYQWAAFITAIAGIIGYFGMLPGASELFTKFGRASGTFKDPNVYGPFLVPALLYAVHQCLTRPLHRIVLPIAMTLFLGFAILLSFSRGAWMNLAVALALYGYFSFVCAPTNRQRLKMVAISLVGLFVVAGAIVFATQIDGVGRLLEDRAQLSHAYDEGPEGRFGGHEKAKRLILDNPLGIGAGTFTEAHHHEDVHNVYLSMFLNAGWLGGLVFILMCAITTIYGLRHAFKRTLSQPLFIIALAAFVGNVLEGFVIDIDHWRHFYLLMALVWGMMLGDRRIATLAVRSRGPVRTLPAVMVIPPRRAARLVGRARRQIRAVPHATPRRPTISPRSPRRLIASTER